MILTVDDFEEKYKSIDIPAIHSDLHQSILDKRITFFPSSSEYLFEYRRGKHQMFCRELDRCSSSSFSLLVSVSCGERARCLARYSSRLQMGHWHFVVLWLPGRHCQWCDFYWPFRSSWTVSGCEDRCDWCVGEGAKSSVRMRSVMCYKGPCLSTNRGCLNP